MCFRPWDGCKRGSPLLLSDTHPPVAGRGCPAAGPGPAHGLYGLSGHGAPPPADPRPLTVLEAAQGGREEDVILLSPLRVRSPGLCRLNHRRLQGHGTGEDVDRTKG